MTPTAAPVTTTADGKTTGADSDAAAYKSHPGPNTIFFYFFFQVTVLEIELYDYFSVPPHSCLNIEIHEIQGGCEFIHRFFERIACFFVSKCGKERFSRENELRERIALKSFVKSMKSDLLMAAVLSLAT